METFKDIIKQLSSSAQDIEARLYQLDIQLALARNKKNPKFIFKAINKFKKDNADIIEALQNTLCPVFRRLLIGKVDTLLDNDGLAFIRQPEKSTDGITQYVHFLRHKESGECLVTSYCHDEIDFMTQETNHALYFLLSHIDCEALLRMINGFETSESIS